MAAEDTKVTAPSAEKGAAPAAEQQEPPRPHGDPLTDAPVDAPEEQAPAETAPADEPPAEPEDEAAKYLALAQRTQADFENYRKRMARESAAAIDRGVGKLAKELLPALDHLELALQSAEQHDAGDWVKGIRLVQDEFVSALGRAGIQPFSPKGEPFDPLEHEAMASQPAPDGTESGVVLEVYQQGYRLNGAVLRPARVVVAA